MTARRVAAGLLVAAACAAAGFWAGRAVPGRADLADLVAGGPPDLSAFDAPLGAAAVEFRLDPDLLRAMVATESSGDPRATSRAGAVGLLQLLPTTAADQARALRLDAATIDLTDPATNLRLGARYFARLLDQFGGEPAFAIAAYNAGPEHVKRWRLRAVDADAREAIRREGFPETRRHVDRVLKYRDAYRAKSGH